MAALVAVTMSLTATVLYQRQYSAMLEQATGYGGSLAKLVAVQTAVPLLSEDWAAIDVFIQETQNRQEFPYLVVVDHKGVIRGSNDAKEVNAKYSPPDLKPMESHDAGVTVASHRLADKRSVIDFTVPILFQAKEIGQIHLGLFEAPLTKVANLMLVLLTILTLITSAAVAGGTICSRSACPADTRAAQFAATSRQRPLRLPYRLDKRKDEFGELYADFDRAAAAMDQRHEQTVAAPKPE
jgi:serine/threonine-protein kinase